jgi:hypothetical protein
LSKTVFVIPRLNMKKLLIFILTFCSVNAFGTHLRCGYISVEAVNKVSRTYKITITVFLDAGADVNFGGTQNILDFGDGTRILVPERIPVPRPDLGNDVAMASFNTFHTFPGPGKYTISYIETNRNHGIINFTNSTVTTFYLETTINISLSNFSFPLVPLTDPVFAGTLGNELSVSAGLLSNEDYIYYYSLVTPLSNRDVSVGGYVLPEGISIDRYNGLITWDTKFNGTYVPGEYLFAVSTLVYIVVDDAYFLVGEFYRDIQIILISEENPGGRIHDNQKDLDEHSSFYLPENEEKKIKVFFETEQTEPIEINAFSELDENEEVFSFATYDSAFNDTRIKVGVITLNSISSTVRDNPYLITVRGTLKKSNFYSLDKNYLFYTNEIPDRTHFELIVKTDDDLIPIVHVYPNPTKQFLKIVVEKSRATEVLIYDQQGKLRWKQPIKEDNTIIDLTDFANGLYIGEIRRGRVPVKKIRIIKN